ncbi:recombinase family protein [Acetobacter malorum]|uniref:recombinase family protein n=1 Tax=Acetobacter malorum TaxID=178901 RepID=UPI000A7212E4|nr:recombinase family protein [Acetobacter malorum]
MFTEGLKPASEAFWENLARSDARDLLSQTSSGVRVGYARVSRREKQNLSLQVRALEKEGCVKIFKDTCSGKTTDRPALQAMLSYLRPGDEVVVWRTDRLGRDTQDLLSLTDQFSRRGVVLRSITEPIYNTTGATGRLLLQFIAVISEFERNVIAERTKAGLEAARARGIKLGRKRALTKEQALHINKALDQSDLSIQEAADMFSVSRSTVARIRRDYLSARKQSFQSS